MNSYKRTTSAGLQNRDAGWVQLGDRYSVSEDFYLAIWWQAIANLPDLDPEGVFTAQEILGDAFWEELLAEYDHPAAGRCLSHMVVTGRLPALVAVLHSGSTKRYRFKRYPSSTGNTESNALPFRAAASSPSTCEET